MRALHRSLPLAAVALGAGIAFAGTPLPDPPFSNGGFVPPDSLAYKSEVYLAKHLVKYALKAVKCDETAVTGLQLAYTPANPTKITELQAKWTGCKAKIDLYYTKGRDKILLKGTPACLDQSAIDAIRAQIDAQLAVLAPIVFCDADGADPDPVTGLKIPDFKKEAEGEVAVSKLLGKLGKSAAKCYLNGVNYAFKFGGAVPQIYLDRVQACFTKYEALGLEKVGDLDQQQKLPDCIPVATAEGLVATAIAFPGQFTDENFCASPSGAFLD